MTRTSPQSPPGAGLWDAVPPPGWEPVADVCKAVYLDLAAVTERINAAIASEIPEFGAEQRYWTAEDLYWSTSRNVAGFLRGIAENRGPSEREISLRRLVSRRSAERGLALQALVGCFHIGYRELWSGLVEKADEIGGRAPRLLLRGGATIWQWMHAATSVIADEYNQEVARREAVAARRTSHFVEAMLQDAASDECRSLAVELDLLPDGPFRVLSLIGPVTSVDKARAIVAAIQQRGRHATSAQRGRTAVVIVQRLDDRALAEVLEPWRDTPIGVGLEREGLEGARLSLLESEGALDLAVLRGGVCFFERDWIASLARSHWSSIESKHAPGIRVAVERPHIADAVRVLAESGFSVAEGARRLLISQNSFRYRLARWQALTDWDLWTYDGLTRSLTALQFVPTE